MKVLKIMIISIFLLLTGIVGINLAIEPLIGLPVPFWLKANVRLDGVDLTGTDETLTIKVTNTSGTEFKPVDTAGQSFGAVTADRFSYNIPKYDATDQREGAQTNQKACISLYKSGTQLKMSYPAQGSCPANSGEITIGADGESIGFGISATYQFTDPITVTTPVPVLSMTYDSTQIQNNGTINFGDVTFTGGGSKKFTLKFTNNGDDGTTLQITNITLSGAGVAAYQLSSTANLSIQKGQTTNNSFDITFTPTAEQTYSATITFKANTGVAGALQDYTINLTGKGIPEAVAALSVSNNVVQGALQFGLVKVGSSKEETVTITSTGDYKLIFGQGALGGTNSDQFSITSDTCSNKTLQNKNDTCEVKIKFAPTSQGAKQATVTTLSNVGKTGQTKDTPDVQTQIQLTGIGGIGDIAVNPANLDFGEVLVGGQKQLQIVVQNNGNFNLSITNITLPAGYALSQVPQYPVVIPPGQTQNFTVVFSPAAAQTYAGNMTIYSDDPDTPQKVVPVTGKGITEAVAVSSSSINFGKVILPDGQLQGAPQGCVMDQGKAKCPLEITNVSPQDLNNIALSTQGAQFSVNPATINLGTTDATKKQTVNVFYTPAASKTAHTGKLTIAPQLGAPREVTLTGETNTRPDKPANLAVENNDAKLTPTLKTGAFSDQDGDAHKGTQWTIKDNNGNTVFQSTAMTQQGTYEAAFDTNNLTAFIVPKGILKYATTYKFTAKFKDSRDVESVSSDEFSFTTPAKPAGVDDYGVATIATSVKDSTGATVDKIDTTNIGTLKNDKTIQTAIPQITKVDAVITAGNVKDDAGNVLATINTGDLKIVKSDGGVGKPLVVAPSTGHTITMIEPIDTAGKTVDANGNKTVTAIQSINVGNISLPYGLFNITVNVAAGSTTKVVIVPPTPFASNTKWYKYDPADGKVKEYPNFKVDKDGNGVLTLTDNGAGDMDPTPGVIKDPGGPGGVAVAGGTTGESSSKGGCFIATAAFGSYFDPCVEILRRFRDTYLLTSTTGSKFVELYYRVSPPLADFIRNNEALKITARIMLVPAIGFSAMSLKIGLVPTSIIFALILAGIILAIRRIVRKRLV